MAFTEEDKIAIKFLRENKNYGAKRILKEFPNKGWSLGGLSYLLQKIDQTGTVKRRKGSGRKRTVLIDDNINAVNELVLSQEEHQQTHRSQREIARQTGVSRSSVSRIVKKELNLKCFKKHRATELTESNKVSRLSRCKKLLRRFPEHKVSFIFFTDEKLFTVARPINKQNDRVYAPATARKKDISAVRLLRTKPTFSKSVMVSVGVSSLGATGIYFVEPGVKINGEYYRNKLLKNCLLPDMKEMSELFIFQQDGAPAHTARDTVVLLTQETPEFIEPNLWPPNSPDLNPVDYGIWGVMQEKVYQSKISSVDELKNRIRQAWSELEQSIINAAVKKWQIRLKACVAAGGGYFEHQFK